MQIKRTLTFCDEVATEAGQQVARRCEKSPSPPSSKTRLPDGSNATSAR
jgi:hypothetical protein